MPACSQCEIYNSNNNNDLYDQQDLAEQDHATLHGWDVRVQEFTTADGKKLTGKRAYLTDEEEKEQGADNDGNVAGADNGSHYSDMHKLEADTLKVAVPASKRGNAAAKRKGTPNTAPAAKRKAAVKRGSSGWDPQSRVTFDI